QDPIFDPSDPSATGPDGGTGNYNSNVLTYDSLGDTQNVNFNWTKIGNNAWSLAVTPPAGAAVTTVKGTANALGVAPVYSSAGQIEFNSVPSAGSYFTLTDTTAGGTSKNIRIQFYNSSLTGTGSTDPTSDTTSGSGT